MSLHFIFVQIQAVGHTSVVNLGNLPIGVGVKLNCRAELCGLILGQPEKKMFQILTFSWKKNLLGLCPFEF